MSIITPSGLPTELTEITNGETLIEVYNPDTGQNEKTEIDTIKQYIADYISGATILDAIFPIGKRVIQLPGESSPAAIYTSQTWVNISSSFAGDFFRVEGGKANTYDSGEQEDAMQRITGSIGERIFTVNIGGGGGISGVYSGTTSTSSDTASRVSASNRGIDSLEFDSSLSTSPNPAKTDDYETRPTNWTIRIWERTA